MTDSIAFHVLGEPSPEGSTRSFYIPKLNRTVTTHQNQSALNAWRNRVATEAQNMLNGREWTSDATSSYSVEVVLVLPRPPSVARHKRIRPIVKPDIDKLLRAINDALTGILWPDDCQVTSAYGRKEYVDEHDIARAPGAYIYVQRRPNTAPRPPRRGAK